MAVPLYIIAWSGALPSVSASGPGPDCGSSQIEWVNVSNNAYVCSTVEVLSQIVGNPTIQVNPLDQVITSFNDPWDDVVISSAPCYTSVTLQNSYSYGGTSDNLFYSYQYMRADATSSCSSNSGSYLDNIGTHAGAFDAWKSSGSTYTVTAYFSAQYITSAATYCDGGSPTVEGLLNMSINDAVYDDTTGKGVGASSETSITLNSMTACNEVGDGGLPNAQSGITVSFTTSAINYDDQLVPRCSVWPYAYANAPWDSGEVASHASGIQNNTAQVGGMSCYEIDVS